MLTFHVSSLHLLHFVGATMREVATCCQPDSPRRVRGDEAHTPPLVLACFSMAARSQARFRGETIWPTRIAVNGIDCRLRSDGSDRRPRTGFVVNGRRTVAQNAARNPGVVYRMGANSLIYNNRHENFSFFLKSPRQRRNISLCSGFSTATTRLAGGPRGSGKHWTVRSSWSIKSRHKLVITFRGLRPLTRKQPAGRFAVL